MGSDQNNSLNYNEKLAENMPILQIKRLVLLWKLAF